MRRSYLYLPLGGCRICASDGAEAEPAPPCRHLSREDEDEGRYPHLPPQIWMYFFDLFFTCRMMAAVNVFSLLFLHPGF
jgi:hypothetical protein